MFLRLRTLLLVTLCLALPLKGMAAVGFMACAPGGLLPSAGMVAAPTPMPPCHGDAAGGQATPADGSGDMGATLTAPDGSTDHAPGHTATSKPAHKATCQTCAPCCTPALPAPLPIWPASHTAQPAPTVAGDPGAADAPNAGLDRPPRRTH